MGRSIRYYTADPPRSVVVYVIGERGVNSSHPDGLIRVLPMSKPAETAIAKLYLLAAFQTPLREMDFNSRGTNTEVSIDPVGADVPVAVFIEVYPSVFTTV